MRTANAIDPASRTLLVEIDVDNRKGELMPGSLAQVHFKAPAVQTFIVPVSAIIFRREGTQVGTLGADNTAHVVPVTIGQDDGKTVQIVSGLKAGDRVIQDPPDSLIDGEKVNPQHPSEEQQNDQQGQGGKRVTQFRLQAAGPCRATGACVAADRLHGGAKLSPARSLRARAAHLQGGRTGKRSCAAAESEWRHLETGDAVRWACCAGSGGRSTTIRS